MKRIIFFLLILLLLAAETEAQKKSVGSLLQFSSPGSQGFSPERLTRLDNVFKEYVDSQWCNGAVGLVAINGKIVYYKAFGYNDIELKTPLEKNVIFRIASQTKAITSVAVMMLYEQGKFLLDDPVFKYLPEFKNQRVLDKFNEEDSTYTIVEAKRPVTIRDLLTHTSGIGYPMIGSKGMNYLYNKFNVVGAISTDKTVLKDQMKILGSVPLGHQPGEKWTYGLSVDVLGYLVEVVSGMNLDQFLRKNIFDPLGMSDTYFYLPKEKYNRLAILYSEDQQKHLVKIKKSDGFNPDYPASDGTYFAGGGGLASTAYDYAVFMQMLLNEGEYNGKRLLAKSTVRLMRTNQIGDLTIPGLYTADVCDKFGLGFEIISSIGSTIVPLSEGSYGWGGTFGSLYWIDPKEKIIAQLVLQKAPNSFEDLRGKFISLIYQAKTK